jgi:probable rRNA maturation factor
MLDVNFVEGVFFDFDQKRTEKWLEQVAVSEGKSLGDVTLIFCSDSYLLQMNNEHLDHDYFTDIITFDYCEGEVVSGDLFISIDRVRDNAYTENVYWLDELLRVVVHGTLHLLGYGDKSQDEFVLMRKKEDEKLALLSR